MIDSYLDTAMVITVSPGAFEETAVKSAAENARNVQRTARSSLVFVLNPQYFDRRKSLFFLVCNISSTSCGLLFITGLQEEKYRIYPPEVLL